MLNNAAFPLVQSTTNVSMVTAAPPKAIVLMLGYDYAYNNVGFISGMDIYSHCLINEGKLSLRLVQQ